MAQFGRFILNRDIVDIANQNFIDGHLGKGNELWTIDQIIAYAKEKPVYALDVEGEWTTTGDPVRYMKTQVKYALKDKLIGSEFAEFIKSLKL
jgi:UTP--glucose-1-phosphate uridylyltransferase